jgi:hypothetical protein
MTRRATVAPITLAAAAALLAGAAPAPDREAAWRENNVGVALLEQYDHKKAADAFHRALEADPTLDAARVNLAIALFYVPDIAGAKVAATEAVARLPESPHLNYLLALVARFDDDPAEAEARLRRVLAADPGDFGANLVLGQVLVDRERYGEAVGHLDRASRGRAVERLGPVHPGDGARPGRAPGGEPAGDAALPGAADEPRPHELRQDLPRAGALRGGDRLDRRGGGPRGPGDPGGDLRRGEGRRPRAGGGGLRRHPRAGRPRRRRPARRDRGGPVRGPPPAQRGRPLRRRDRGLGRGRAGGGRGGRRLRQRRPARPARGARRPAEPLPQRGRLPLRRRHRRGGPARPGRPRAHRRLRRRRPRRRPRRRARRGAPAQQRRLHLRRRERRGGGGRRGAARSPSCPPTTTTAGTSTSWSWARRARPSSSRTAGTGASRRRRWGSTRRGRSGCSPRRTGTGTRSRTSSSARPEAGPSSP